MNRLLLFLFLLNTFFSFNRSYSSDFSLTNNFFSVDNTNNSSVLSELNDYSSSLSISEGFKDQFFGLNIGFRYKAK